MASAPQIPIESLYGLIRDAHTVDRSGVAAAAALVYDIVICMDQEIEYIWKSAWTPPKFLYLFSRYFALIVQVVNMHESTDYDVTDAVSIFTCHSWTMFEGVAGQLIVMGVEISLMLRLYALYRRDIRMLVFLVCLYIAEVTANSVILGLALLRIVSVAPLRGIFPPGFPLSGCFPTFVPSYFYSYWIPVLIFESILFVLMVANFVQHARVHKTPVPILVQFFRDGTVFYAAIFATLLTQVLLYELVNSALAQVAIAWELTVFSVAGARLILSLRASAVAGSTPPGARMGRETLEMMRFDGDARSGTARQQQEEEGVATGLSLSSSATTARGPSPGALKLALPTGTGLASGSGTSTGSSGYGTVSSSVGRSGDGDGGAGEGQCVAVLGVGSVGSVGSEGTYVGGEKGALVRVRDDPDTRARGRDDRGATAHGEGQIGARETGGGDDVEAARPSPGPGPGSGSGDAQDWMAEWGKLVL